MSIYTRYFRVTGGPLMNRALEMDAANHEARKLVVAFCNEIGAENARMYNDGTWAGFEFKQTPDQMAWKKPNSVGAYWPRKSTTAGSDMLARIDRLPRIVHVMNAIEAVGLFANSPVLIDGRSGYRSTLTGLPRTGVLFVGVPWRDVNPEELAEYRAAREAGQRYSMEMDHLGWEPTADMQEVKRWEVEKELEQLNDQLRAEQKAVTA